MKRIWLVYQEANVQRNRFFIERWQEAGRNRGVAVHLVTVDQLCWGLRQNKPFVEHLNRLPLPDACVMRLNHPLLSAQFEAMGVPCFNNARIARICNDKRLSHLAVSPYVPCMDSIFLQDNESRPPFPFPFVVKDVLSCGGRAVWLVHNDAAFQAALSVIPPGQAMAQVLSDTPGRDVRAYVLGKNIIAVMMRVSEKDFRSNIGQGGSAVPYTLTPEETKMVHDVVCLFDIGLVGVDFIFHQGRLVFNEIEDAVGTRMLYEQGKIDIAALYLDLILSSLA